MNQTNLKKIIIWSIFGLVVWTATIVILAVWIKTDFSYSTLPQIPFLQKDKYACQADDDCGLCPCDGLNECVSFEWYRKLKLECICEEKCKCENGRCVKKEEVSPTSKVTCNWCGRTCVKYPISKEDCERAEGIFEKQCGCPQIAPPESFICLEESNKCAIKKIIRELNLGGARGDEIDPGPVEEECQERLENYLKYFKDDTFTDCRLVESRVGIGDEECPDGWSPQGCSICKIECW